MTSIVTVRVTNQITAQGELVQPSEKPFCSCADGYVSICRCDCPQGWAHRITVDTGSLLVRGQIITRIQA